ncbi:MAG: aldose epimerase family protein, partial [Pirellulales bacterium]
TTFGTLPDGTEIEQYTLSGGAGLEVEVITYGATIRRVAVPDRDGNVENVTLHLPSLDEYVAGHPLFGCVAGRYANRIAGGRFTLDGTEYTLATNDGRNHLHGGKTGFDKKVWQAEPVERDDARGVRLTYVSPDGEEGYPGTLTATVLYELTDDNRLVMDYTAVTDKPTVVNLTNHAYWNLGGATSGDVLGHQLMINAERFLPTDHALIPLGPSEPVAETPMDFREPHPIGSRIERVEGGYDHCYVLKKPRGETLPLAARVIDPASGRVMEVRTTQPGVQLYTANFLDGSHGVDGHRYGEHAGLCLETQHFPDSPNRPEYPSTVLRPGETYHDRTEHRFLVQP